MLHIIGIVGVPAKYGGFETLVDYLLDSKKIKSLEVVVYCEKEVCEAQKGHYKGAKLASIKWRANGWQSVFYDLSALWRASKQGGNILILGTSATFIIPVLRCFFPSCTFIVNMAGLEWSRSKWGAFASWFLKFNEMMAAKFAHFFITDNKGLTDYIRKQYNKDSIMIPYGGDQFLEAASDQDVFNEFDLPDEFDFAMARSQIDNNMEVILDAYAKSGQELVFVSNWKSSTYGKALLEKYVDVPNLNLIGPIYDVGKIKALYQKTRIYIHGHSAGGTNPVLVESMWARLPVLAFDVTFNRHTTHNKAFYFKDSQELAKLSQTLKNDSLTRCAQSLYQIANDCYKWEHIQSCYESVIFNEAR